MLTLYRILIPFILVLALPFQIRKMWRRGGYRDHFGMRFGSGWRLPSKTKEGQRIWIQAVSVGEVNATLLLVNQMAAVAPSAELVITTTTSTGFARLRAIQPPNVVAIGYFPIDWWPFTRRAFSAINPDKVVLFEGEVWPEFLHEAKRRRVATFLINARLSDRSFRRWRRFRFLATGVFGKIDQILATSPEDADRFRVILPRHRPAPTVTGNIKCDLPPRPPDPPEVLRSIGTELGILDPDTSHLPPVLFGVSTWPGEESLLIDVFSHLLPTIPDLRLVLCPRHAERRNEILQILRHAPFSFHFKTGFGPNKEQEASASSATIGILDTTGDLSRCLAIATIAVVGKSFPPNQGGQSPLDPAQHAVPTVFGPAMSNFRSIAASMVESGAAIRTDPEHLPSVLQELLSDPAARSRKSQNTQRWLNANRGAVARTAKALTAHAGQADSPPLDCTVS